MIVIRYTGKTSLGMNKNEVAIMGNKKGMSAFGVWLKATLMECGMKQKDLAKAMNTSEACVSRWINGNRIPENKQLSWILDYFDCHIEIVPNGMYLTKFIGDAK